MALESNAYWVYPVSQCSRLTVVVYSEFLPTHVSCLILDSLVIERGRTDLFMSNGWEKMRAVFKLSFTFTVVIRINGTPG